MKWIGVVVAVAAVAWAIVSWHWLSIVVLVIGIMLWGYLDERQWDRGRAHGSAQLSDLRVQRLSHDGPSLLIRCRMAIALPDGASIDGIYTAEVSATDAEQFQEGMPVPCEANPRYRKRVRTYPYPQRTRYIDFRQ